MSSSETPGSPSAAYTQSLRRRRWSSPMVDGLDTSNSEPFRGYLLVRSRYNLPSCSPPLRDLYFRAFDGSVALPIAEYNYSVRLGNLHRWDFHPLERQLASLQPPSGSSADVARGSTSPLPSQVPVTCSPMSAHWTWCSSEAHIDTGRLCSAGSRRDPVPRRPRSYAALRLPASVGHGSGSPCQWPTSMQALVLCRVADDTCAHQRVVHRRRVTGSPPDRDESRRGEGLPGAWAVLFVRAMVEHPAGYAPLLAHLTERLLWPSGNSAPWASGGPVPPACG